MDPAPLASGAALAGSAYLAWAVRGRSSAVFGSSVWRGSTARRSVALTFDDGPSESTSQILEILARYQASATFFQVGLNVERLPQVAREVAAAGHPIGNHSHTHPLFCFRSPRFIEADLTRAQQAIQHHTGVAPTWFRAPFGVRWFGMGSAQRRLGLTGVMWSTIGYDWNRRADYVVDRLMAGGAPGAIFCLHDGRELRTRPDISVTVEAVRQFVPRLIDQGYRFETLPQLLCPTI